MTMLIIFAVCGCRLTGPSDREIMEAMEAVMRGFETSMNEDTLEINNAYANAADAVFRNEDHSAVTKMTALMNENQLHVYGNCLFSEYQDASSDYLLSGELTYNLKSIGSSNSNAWYGDMGCTVELSGGNIQTLEFSFSLDEDGNFIEYMITANDIDIDMNTGDSLMEILQRFGRGMPG